MQKILLYITYVLFFVLASIYFLPKASMYYAFEEVLEKRGFVLSNERITENFASVELKNIKLYYKEQFIQNIDQMSIYHQLEEPLYLQVKAQGKLGILNAKINLINQKVILNLKASAFMRRNHNSILKKMQFNKGVHTYEFKY